jgi:prepilin-type N-terminal cleavage/methylation domain-containing protein
MIHGNKQRGFTAIELIIVIAIIGILVTIGNIQYKTANAQQQLNHAATQLVADIRWMQQLSANDENWSPSPGLRPDQNYKLHLSEGALGGYIVSGFTKNLKTIVFYNDNVQATIMTPANAVGYIDIQYYPFDLDLVDPVDPLGGYMNKAYQIKLTHNVTHAVIFINVDCPVGRVWTNINGDPPISPT